MLKGIVMGLLFLGMALTLYQLYLSNSWAGMIKQKQEDYTTTPPITNNTKALTRRAELCTLCLVCVFFIPFQTNGQFTSPKLMDKAAEENIENSIAYFSEEGTGTNDELPKPGAQLASTTKKAMPRELPNSEALIQMLVSEPKHVSVSLEMLNQGAKMLDETEFLALFDGKELFLSKEVSLKTCDYIVRASSEDIAERELLFKEEAEQYTICDSVDEICYYVNK